jgi:alcohol dehydrogenase, propanol-preferring
MRAMELRAIGEALRPTEREDPRPATHQLLIRVRACGVCRTDLHLVDGELPGARLPVIPGHEIIGTVIDVGESVSRLSTGMRVGVPWLGWSCGQCRFCLSGRENLCPRARFTGCDIDGGYAELVVADERFCFPLPEAYGDEAAAPLMCAGLIGYRAYCMAGEAEILGIYGFGAAAHIIIQIALHRGQRVFAFTRADDRQAQDFARELGAEWAGDSESAPPQPIDAAVIFAPVGSLVPAALKTTVKGGTVVCAGIHMSDIPSFPYRLLWEERVLRSVANLTRGDAEAFLALSARVPIRTHTEPFPLNEANRALAKLRAGDMRGAAVLVP